MVLPDFPVLCVAKWSPFFLESPPFLPDPVPLFQCCSFPHQWAHYFPKALFSLSGSSTDSLSFSVPLKQSHFSFLTTPLPRSHPLLGLKYQVCTITPTFIFPVPFLYWVQGHFTSAITFPQNLPLEHLISPQTSPLSCSLIPRVSHTTPSRSCQKPGGYLHSCHLWNHPSLLLLSSSQLNLHLLGETSYGHSISA